VLIALFAYDMPHRKTQDLFARLNASQHTIAAVIAAPPVALNIPHASIRTKLRHVGLIHPRELAEAAGIPYRVAEHNSTECAVILKDSGAQAGVIGGARILKGAVLNAAPLGIVNFHPGKIPEARGLDALFWSVYRDIDVGVTSHVIDERVDGGRIVEWRPLPLHADDTFLDLGERLIEIQTDMVLTAIERIEKGRLQQVQIPKDSLNRKMPVELEAQLPAMLPAYLRRRVSA